nr:MAG TPA: hypothetical protein [Caudoviricetes sp.]
MSSAGKKLARSNVLFYVYLIGNNYIIFHHLFLFYRFVQDKILNHITTKLIPNLTIYI